jgi:hypothetical protein
LLSLPFSKSQEKGTYTSFVKFMVCMPAIWLTVDLSLCLGIIHYAHCTN